MLSGSNGLYLMIVSFCGLKPQSWLTRMLPSVLRAPQPSVPRERPRNCALLEEDEAGAEISAALGSTEPCSSARSTVLDKAGVLFVPPGSRRWSSSPRCALPWNPSPSAREAPAHARTRPMVNPRSILMTPSRELGVLDGLRPRALPDHRVRRPLKGQKSATSQASCSERDPWRAGWTINCRPRSVVGHCR